ncbi:hypothetical protein KQI76_08120 [Amphibacillus sp. MSJ-3]|uniref:site-2 protease family protein n=1 Tax=Amphibacillus sp. MSJ-3 TaxID=2841505 RepID=UPI001C0F3860|nr:site-2 protease family protein [Amphibacillus sp. MSJ-3]MBU5595129.1 hypothetical protein [Amphibacillus sp. MSJ-3]
MKKKKLLSILMIALCVIIGFSIGIFLAIYDVSIDFTLTDIVILYLLLMLSLFCVINIHELGHYLFGKLLGYQLLMYRIGFLSFTYENGKMKFELIKNKGYSGLCAMVPPKGSDFRDKKHILYYGGGIIFNILSGLLILFALPFATNLYTKSFIYLFSLSSLLLGLINLIPFKTAGNQLSDGKIIFSMIKIEQTVPSMLATMNLYTQLAGGIRPKKLNFNLDYLTDTSDPSLLLLQYYQALDREDNDQIAQFANKLIQGIDDFSTIILPGIYNELITAGVLLNKPEWVTKYYALNEKTLTRDHDLNGERVKAHYYWYLGDFDQAKKHIKQAKAVANKFPIRGQISMEQLLIANLEKRLEQVEIEMNESLNH